jgi:hypothetical protein
MAPVAELLRECNILISFISKMITGIIWGPVHHHPSYVEQAGQWTAIAREGNKRKRGKGILHV